LRSLAHPQCAALQSALAPPVGSAALREWALRSALYSSLAAGDPQAVPPAGGTTQQGFSVENLFVWDPVTGLPSPRLQRLDVPVRAVVLPLPASSAAAASLAAAAATALLPLCGVAGVWLQDPTAFHASLFHASTHLDPVQASDSEVDSEAAASAAVLNQTCAIKATLERVIITRTGVFIACWNVRAGGQPAALRAALRAALPRAPTAQLLRDAVILHSTLARVLRPPRGGAPALAAAAKALSAKLCGTEVVLDAAWFVLEHDALAMALQGSYAPRRLPLRCAVAAAGKEAGEADALR
jgi:hypothetical protein